MKTTEEKRKRTWKLNLVLTALTAAAIALPLAAAGRATDAFRREHAQIKEHLTHLDAMAGRMARGTPAEQKKTAQEIAAFLNDHILEHAKWEESHLYPAVDKRTHEGEYRFTTTMRYEHGIIGRSIKELKSAASGGKLDAKAFARKTDRTLGLITAHFEEEEEVLLPVLDRTTTREALEKELGM